MVCGRICLADGSIAFMRTGRLSVVPALAPAVRAVGLDGADHHLDREHHPNLLRLGFGDGWLSVVGSWLDYAGGIRMRGNGRCNHPVASVQTSGGNPMLNGLGALANAVCKVVGNNKCARMSMPRTQSPMCAVECVASRAGVGNGWRGCRAVCRHTIMYPQAFPRHPRQHPFNSPRSKIHDKCEPYNDHPFSGFRGSGSCCNSVGTESAANSRIDRQNLWSRFVWANRGYPLHLQRGNPRTLQTCSRVGVGAQNRQGLL